MPAVTDYITAKLPALASSPNLALYITDATQRTDAVFYGVNYNLAIALRAMHEYTLDQRNLGAAGAIAGLREGGASIAYAPGKGLATDVDLEQTSFGRRLRGLRRASTPAASVLGVNDVAAAGMNAPGSIIDSDDSFRRNW
jgi:hypothetical protein